MYNQYRNKAAFYVVYLREAHASDGRVSRRNEQVGIKVRQPKSILERATVANVCVKELKLAMPCVIDNMEGTTDRAYTASPDRLYVIDKDDRIAMKGAAGPRGFDPKAAETALKKILANDGRLTKTKN